jgi:hypothetical protein
MTIHPSSVANRSGWTRKARPFVGRAARAIRTTIWSNSMRRLLVFGLLLASCATAAAATRDPLHPAGRLHVQRHRLVNPSAVPPVGPRFAVPGWSNEDTERWLDNASSPWSQA